MRIRIAVLIVALAAALAFSSDLAGPNRPGSAGAKAQKPGLMSGGMPDLSGIWDPDFHGPEGIRLNTWDSVGPIRRTSRDSSHDAVGGGEIQGREASVRRAANV